MKHLRLVLTAILVAVCSLAQATDSPKYIFLFIGDGMGTNIVHTTELYRGSDGDERGEREELVFTQFPVLGSLCTSSANSLVTDSAAAGTAIACGEKINNSAIGVRDEDGQKLTSIAEQFKAQGMGVGVVTTANINHATPAAFYANVKSRREVDEIARQGASSGFDVFGGGSIVTKRESRANIYDMYEAAGYTHIEGKAELSDANNLKTKLLITEREGFDDSSLSYATDRVEPDLALKDIVEVAIEHLYKGYESEGFFLMAEGGKIDWAMHANDINTAIKEVIDFDEALELAYEFYLEHPAQTLIIVTSDHETGGFSLISDSSKTRGLWRLCDSLPSRQVYTTRFIDEVTKQTTFEQIPPLGTYQFSDKELQGLRSAFELYQTQDGSDDNSKKGLYEDAVSDFVVTLYSYINEGVGAGWATSSHTASPVPLYAIGAGADHFSGTMENSDIPQRIRSAIQGSEKE